MALLPVWVSANATMIETQAAFFIGFALVEAVSWTASGTLDIWIASILTLYVVNPVAVLERQRAILPSCAVCSTRAVGTAVGWLIIRTTRRARTGFATRAAVASAAPPMIPSCLGTVVPFVR
jgi:hypothetical protein